MQLKSQCQQRYDALRVHMLDFLINADWVNAESAEKGVSVTSEELQREFERIKHETFPVNGAFERFLRFTGLSISDEMLRIKKDVLDAKIQQKIAAERRLSGPGREEVLAKFDVEFKEKWAVRTSCSAGYVMMDCKQYKGAGDSQAEIQSK